MTLLVSDWLQVDAVLEEDEPPVRRLDEVGLGMPGFDTLGAVAPVRRFGPLDEGTRRPMCGTMPYLVEARGARLRQPTAHQRRTPAKARLTSVCVLGPRAGGGVR
ncbi:hypothetical protein [Actinomadura sp. 3N508]|uniref:hypothetical protein n=1 Tax=Actinomadura sp. 3N508 TaxID=3375153 RepID=UPI003798483C